VVFAPGDRVAQLTVVAVPGIVWEGVEELDETDRGASGFGSTGT
jgi:dUTPase